MSAAISTATGKLYGVERVCAAWEEPRSSYYGRKARSTKPVANQKRGPKTTISDEELLALIRTDLATSRFTGEGHRKVYARLRFVKGHKIGRKRVLRIMREHNLLSPHRVFQGPPKEHTGKIITAAPNMQVIYGRTYRTIEELRLAIADFIERYNKYWLVEKLGFKNPLQAYEEHQRKAAA